MRLAPQFSFGHEVLVADRSDLGLAVDHKSFSDFSGDIATSVKDKASETSERVKDGLADATTMAKGQVAKFRDGIDGEGPVVINAARGGHQRRARR